MKKAFAILLAAVCLTAVSCEDKLPETQGGKDISVTASVVSDFDWPDGATVGLFTKEVDIPIPDSKDVIKGALRTSNALFTVQSVDASGAVTMTGKLPKKGVEVYSYYPYGESNGLPSSVLFTIQNEQRTEDNAKLNTLLVGSGDYSDNISLEYRKVSSTIDFRITVPTGDSHTISSIVIVSPGQSFATRRQGDVTIGAFLNLPHNPYNSVDRMTLNISNPAATAGGSTLAAKLYVFPDSYLDNKFEIDVVTPEGNYYFEHMISGEIRPGENYVIEYTVDPDDWYDPSFQRITAEGLPTISPLDAPVRVNFANILAAGITPAKITLTPEDSGDEVQYTLNANDVASGSATISGGAPGNRALPDKTYTVRVYDGADTIVGLTTVTTPEFDTSNVQILNPGDDLRAAILAPDRKPNLFLMPGTYTLTSATAVTADLTISGDIPANTVINATAAFTPKSVTTLTISNLTWKMNSGASVVNPTANAANGSYVIGNLTFKSMVFDFTEHTGNNPVIYRPAASTAGYTGRLVDFVIDDVIMCCCPVGADAVITQSYGGNLYAEFERITFRNSTFTNFWQALMVLPAGNATYPLTSVRPEFTMENCTLYNSTMNTAPTGATAIFHLGSSAETSMTVLFSFKNNVIHFGGSTNYHVLNCTAAAREASMNNQFNNWGLTGQRFRLMSSQSGQPLGFYNDAAVNSATALFENPMNNAADPAASFRILPKTSVSITTGTQNISEAGDPRWNR